jgi:hypothetical protein
VDLTVTVIATRDDETIEELTRRAEDIIEVLTSMRGVRYAEPPRLEPPPAASE